ncbi:MAG TPA: type II secretion system protein [Streptosporangiaceae bacterium]|nr:type II secretion system protein [Streptosporangiaceae bacterium]
MTGLALSAVLAGAVVGAGVFLLAAALRGLPIGPPGGAGRLLRLVRGFSGARAVVAVVAGLVAVVATHWLVAGIGVALLVLSWRGLSGAGGERRAMVRLEALAVWTESLRDSIAGAAGLEQAIPASLRAAQPVLVEPLTNLVNRLHVRVPMADALMRLADDLDDPGADLIIAALILNSRLRGPGLRDLLGSLSTSVREELDMRRKVHADRRSTRRSVQIVVIVSVGMALGLATIDHPFLAPYDSPFGQVILVGVAALYALGIIWLRRLAVFEAPQRLLTSALRSAPAEPPLTVGQRTPTPAGQGLAP